MLASEGAACLGLAATVAAAGQPLTVVELLTSQGCSSCPPADANLVKVRGQPNALALSFNVTYWNYLGWKDTFGRQDFTQRQVAYEPSLGRSGGVAPQVVVNGKADTAGAATGEIEHLSASSGHLKGPAQSLGNIGIGIGAGTAPAGRADIWLARHRQADTGRTLPHADVVRSLHKLGNWTGEATTLALPVSAADLKTAVLVQSPGGGPILAVATN